MKEKTSVTLSPEVLTGIDRLAGSKRSRSAFIEDVLRQYLRERVQKERGARDLAILNKFADEMNAEAEDVLRYQAPED
ncbi:MAG TPA: ribbon-helix-helix protein, CopG family [Candidatus Sulfotelmatobacter sp.]